MSRGRVMEILDERVVRAPVRTVFSIVRDVERWPAHLGHYRWVRFRDRAPDGGGIVEMAAWRPFGVVRWPTWWLSEMAVDDARPAVRFRHIGGITTDMDVEWARLGRPALAPRWRVRGDRGHWTRFHPRHCLSYSRRAGRRGRTGGSERAPRST
jgi:hypothetical protein